MGAAWSVLVLLFAEAASRLPIPAPADWDPATAAAAPPLARFDSGWYFQIATVGYSPSPRGTEGTIGFYPLYPLLVRGVSGALGVAPFRTGIALSVFCLLASLLVIGGLCDAWGVAHLAEGTAAALLLYPTAFFLAAFYSESLFLLATSGALLAARRERWALAGLCGAAAAATRFLGFLVLVPLAVLAFEQVRSGRRPAARIAGFALALGGALAYPAWLFLRFGDPLLYVRSEEAWGRSAAPAWSLAKGVLHDASSQVTHGSGFRLLLWSQVLSWLLFAALAVALFRRKRKAEALYVAATLLAVASSGVTDGWHRYVLVLFPGFAVLAEWLEGRPAWTFACALGGAGLLVTFLTRFVNWIFVA
jgi:hypothetical protein